MKMKFIPPQESVLNLEDITPVDIQIDEEVKASGFKVEDDNLL